MPAKSGGRGRLKQLWSLLTCCGKTGSYVLPSKSYYSTSSSSGSTLSTWSTPTWSSSNSKIPWNTSEWDTNDESTVTLITSKSSLSTDSNWSRKSIKKSVRRLRSLKKVLPRRRRQREPFSDSLLLPPTVAGGHPVLNICLGFEEEELSSHYELLSNDLRSRVQKLKDVAKSYGMSSVLDLKASDPLVDGLPATAWMECIEPTLSILVHLNKLRHRRSCRSKKKGFRNCRVSSRQEQGDFAPWFRGPLIMGPHLDPQLPPEFVFIPELGLYATVMTEPFLYPRHLPTPGYRNRSRRRTEYWYVTFGRTPLLEEEDMPNRSLSAENANENNHSIRCNRAVQSDPRLSDADDSDTRPDEWLALSSSEEEFVDRNMSYQAAIAQIGILTSDSSNTTSSDDTTSDSSSDGSSDTSYSSQSSSSISSDTSWSAYYLSSASEEHTILQSPSVNSSLHSVGDMTGSNFADIDETDSFDWSTDDYSARSSSQLTSSADIETPISRCSSVRMITVASYLQSDEETGNDGDADNESEDTSDEFQNIRREASHRPAPGADGSRHMCHGSNVRRITVLPNVQSEDDREGNSSSYEADDEGSRIISAQRNNNNVHHLHSYSFVDAPRLRQHAYQSRITLSRSQRSGIVVENLNIDFRPEDIERKAGALETTEAVCFTSTSFPVFEEAANEDGIFNLHHITEDAIKNINQSADGDDIDFDDSDDSTDSLSDVSSIASEDYIPNDPDTWFWIWEIQRLHPRKSHSAIGSDFRGFRNTWRNYLHKFSETRERSFKTGDGLQLDSVLGNSSSVRFSFLKDMSVHLDSMEKDCCPHERPLSKAEKEFYREFPTSYSPYDELETPSQKGKMVQHIRRTSRPIRSKHKNHSSKRRTRKVSRKTREKFFAPIPGSIAELEDESDTSSYGLSSLYPETEVYDSDSDSSDGYVICNIISNTSCVSRLERLNNRRKPSQSAGTNNLKRKTRVAPIEKFSGDTGGMVILKPCISSSSSSQCEEPSHRSREENNDNESPDRMPSIENTSARSGISRQERVILSRRSPGPPGHVIKLAWASNTDQGNSISVDRTGACSSTTRRKKNNWFQKTFRRIRNFFVK